MLTLKSPIKLHIGLGLTGNSEAFGERIRGNYSLLGARYTPRDLLFLLTAPPELPEELGSMTTLVNHNSQTDIRSVTMNVVNNVVNRILLDGSEQFTYQDQVYITSVLNQVGITNVQQFMEQIRQLRQENESTVYLTRMYQKELEKVLEYRNTGERIVNLPISEVEEEETVSQPGDPRVEMSMEILQRLNTAKIYDTIHQFQRSWVGGTNQFHYNEFRMAEQLRFSNVVALAELKQEIYQKPQMHLLHHLNRYETGSLLEVPRDEETVIAQVAAAALVTTVDNAVTEIMNRSEFQTEQWVNIENAVWQTAENTVSRFEIYHSPDAPLQQAAEPDKQMAWITQELEEYQPLYDQLYPLAAEYGRVIGEAALPQKILRYQTQAEEAPASFQQPVQRFWSSEETRVLLERALQTSEKQELLSEFTPPQLPELQHMTLTAQQAEEQAPEILVEQLNRINEQNKINLEVLRQTRYQDTAPQQVPDLQRTMKDALRAMEKPGEVLREIYTQPQSSMRHPKYSPQEKAILQQADPVQRTLYERILKYHKDPDGAVAEGLVQSGNFGLLHAELQRMRREDQPLEQEDALMEKVLQRPAQRQQSALSVQTPQALRIVHKKVQHGIAEEVLEKLEQQRLQSTVKTVTDTSVTQQNTEQVDVKQIENKVMTQTTEDITELVNKTLERQMRTISDEVYRHMEKRLQTERSRRGRL